MLTKLLVCVGLVVCLAVAGMAAASKYKACSLITAAEVEAVLKKKISKTDEGDITIPEGLYKGEIMSGCSWAAGGESAASLSVTRAPRNAKERAGFVAILKDVLDTLKKQGWSIQEKTIGGVDCATARPPKGIPHPGSASCWVEKGGLSFSIDITRTGVSAEEVKSLADKAASRIR